MVFGSSLSTPLLICVRQISNGIQDMKKYNTINNSFTYLNLYAKSSHKRPASIVLGRGHLRRPILVSDQL